MAGYKVLIIVKDKWYSDQKSLASYAKACAHRVGVADKWNDCETAILAPDGRILAYKESRQFDESIRKLQP